MKFVIDNISTSSGRLGFLMHPVSGKKFQTPILVQSTKVTYLNSIYMSSISSLKGKLTVSISYFNHIHLETHYIVVSTFAIFRGNTSICICFD